MEVERKEQKKGRRSGEKEFEREGGREGERERERCHLLFTSHLCSAFLFVVFFFCPTICPCNYSQYFFLCFFLSFHIIGKKNYFCSSAFSKRKACYSKVRSNQRSLYWVVDLLMTSFYLLYSLAWTACSSLRKVMINEIEVRKIKIHFIYLFIYILVNIH